MAFKDWFGGKAAIVPVLRLAGPIGVSSPLQPGLSLASLAGLIEKAFTTKKAKAVVLQINSPGGSPVQSALIATRIRSLAKEKKIPVYAFTEDVAASGGYWLACAADEIYADPNSIIGSIGVISASFGFVDAIDKLGIERRVHTAGKNKSILDPFLPLKEEDITRLKSIQLEIHESFIEMVLKRRGERVSAANEDLFTGEFWTGKKAVELGLVDGLSDMRTKMREIYGDKVKLKLIQPKKGLFSRTGLLGATEGKTDLFSEIQMQERTASLAGAGMARELIDSAEVKALWARYGL